jgi:HEAT repeat protein
MRLTFRHRVSLCRCSLLLAITFFPVVRSGHAQGGSVDVAKLLRDLKDQDPAVRGAATQTLTDLRDPRYLPELVRAWKQSSGDIIQRKQLVVTLGNFQDAAAMDALAESMGDAPGDTGLIAARELLALGPAAQQKLVEALLDENRRDGASDALGSNPDLCVELLAPLLKQSKSEEFRAIYINTLASAATRSGVDDHWKRSDEIPGLIYAAASDSSPVVRAAVAGVMQQFADSNRWLDEKGYGAPGYDIEKARPALESLANDPDAGVRNAALFALGSIADAAALETIRKHLNDPDSNVQDTASRQLSGHAALNSAPAGASSAKGKSGKQAASLTTIESIRTMMEASSIPQLIRYLKNSDSLVRAAAADQLGKIDYRAHNNRAEDKAQDLRQVEPLIRALRDTHVLVRAAAEESLGAIGDARAVSPLTALLRDAKPRVVLAALKALADLTGTTENSYGQENAIQTARLEAEVAEGVKPLLHSADSDIRHAAYDLLSRAATPYDTDVLFSAVDDPDTTIQPMALNGLARILVYSTDAAREEGFDEAAGKVFAKKLNDATCRDAAVHGLIALETIPPEAVEPLIRIALENYRKPQFNWTSPVGIADLLKKSGDPRVVPPLITILEQSGDIPNGASVAQALGDLGDPRAIEPLLQALQAPDYQVRFASARALGKFKDPRIVPGLIHALRDKEPGARGEAARSLAILKDARAVPALIHSLTDENAGVSVDVAHALGEIGDASAIAALESVAAHNIGAIAGLARFKTPGTVDFLVAMLSDKKSKMRVDAAIALGTAGDTRAVPALIEAMVGAEPGKDPLFLASKCAEALGKLKDPRAIKPLQEVAQKNAWAQNDARAALLALGATP